MKIKQVLCGESLLCNDSQPPKFFISEKKVPRETSACSLKYITRKIKLIEETISTMYRDEEIYRPESGSLTDMRHRLRKLIIRLI